MQKYAPIVIATLNRYIHLKRCVESLAKNKLATETELVISLDYPPNDSYRDGYQLIKEYLNEIDGFGKITILEQQENLGPNDNFRALREYVKSKGYKKYILTEDDNEFSPNFLEYINWGLDRYESDPSIIAVCGYNEIPTDCIKDNVFLTTWYSAWGTGRWIDKWDNLIDKVANKEYSRRLIKQFPLSTIFKRDIWLASTVIASIEQGIYHGDSLPYRDKEIIRYSIHPKTSMVRNWGRDGSGQHGSNIEEHKLAISRPIDTETTFVPSIIDLHPNQEIEQVCDNHYRIPLLTRAYEICNFLLFKTTGRGLSKGITFYRKHLRKYFRT